MSERRAWSAKYGPAKPKRPAAHRTGRMNGTEARYAEILEARRMAGEVASWSFGSVKFRLAGQRCWYAPDFEVIHADGSVEYVEVKGGGPIRDDAMVKFKVAASLRPWAAWTMARWKGGGWKTLHQL